LVAPLGLRRVLGLLPNGAHNGFGLLAGGFRWRGRRDAPNPARADSLLVLLVYGIA
jgi:hypothetical protein